MSLSILRLLGAKSPGLSDTEGGFGGLSMDDVAGAMGYSGIDEAVIYYTRVKYSMAGQEQVAAVSSMKIQLRLLHYCIDQAVDWPIDKATKLCDLVVRLDIAPSKCMPCLGTGYRNNEQGVYRVCGDCGGSGLMTITNAIKGQFIGVSSQAYRRVWQAREALLVSALSYWESEAHRGLREALKDD